MNRIPWPNLRLLSAFPLVRASLSPAAVRAKVGPCGFSAYVSNAVARQLERDALDAVISRMRTAHSPTEEAEAIMARLAG